ncbi:MAG: cupin domain-containing protein [Bacteroidota bacterium]
MKAYSEFSFTNGLLYDYSTNAYPTRLYAWDGSQRFSNPGSTFFGYVFTGDTLVDTGSNSYLLKNRQYFSFNDSFTLMGGRGIVIERLHYRGMNTLGGPVEKWGRLKYIDGCTDSLLIPPVKMGDPCLNALFFPENIDQTAHTHPSMRVGMVIEGKGTCVTPEQEYELEPGKIFIIHEEGHHKFKTANNATLTVIAYHPDSDFGPVDEDHPMINRTIVEGVSAREIDAIRTK